MAPNFYLAGVNEQTQTSTVNADNGYLSISNNGIYFSGITLGVNDDGKISPQLYFKYIKKKFNFLERAMLDKRIKLIEAAFDEAVENGQNILADKILRNLMVISRESFIAAKGIKEYVERDDVMKYKNQIRGGHISDTMLKDFTRVIPKHISVKIKKLKDIFDDFVIFHYYEQELEEKREKKQKMTPEEKSKMRDPVLFGIIKENNRLYFIDDWEDEKCDLSFDEIVDEIGSKRIGKKIDLIDK